MRYFSRVTTIYVYMLMHAHKICWYEDTRKIISQLSLLTVNLDEVDCKIIFHVLSQNYMFVYLSDLPQPKTIICVWSCKYVTNIHKLYIITYSLSLLILSSPSGISFAATQSSKCSSIKRLWGIFRKKSWRTDKIYSLFKIWYL